MNTPITWDDINLFITNPHLFGHYIGYPDLIDMHSEWIKDAWIRPEKKAMQAHRNSYKTTTILIIGSIWYLLFYDPSATCLIIRKKDTDAQRIVDVIREHFESAEIVAISQFLYKTTVLKTDIWSRISLKLSIKKSRSPEGNIDAKGTTTAITGSHYDFIFPDDIISLKDRVSKAEREWIKSFVRELKNIAKKPDGQIYYSGTPWHKDDAWSILPEPKRYPAGEVLIPGFRKHELEATMEDIKTGNTKSLVDANYRLVHTSDENKIFNEPKLGEWPNYYKIINAYLDPSYQGSNTTALALILMAGHQPYLTGWAWPGHVNTLYGRIANILTEWKCGTLYVESNADKGYSANDLKKFWTDVRPVNESSNKHIKIISFLNGIWNDLIIYKNCQDDFLNQILDYQEGEEPDDAPDAGASLIREMRIGKQTIYDRFGVST